MTNLKLKKMVSFRNFAALLFVSAALARAMYAQAPRQLRVEVGPNEQVRILASDVSYGEVLRALRSKLGWEIEISPLADELKLSYIRVETTQPQIALTKLLEGSKLDYAFLGVNGIGTVKVVVIPLAPREARPTPDSPSNPPIPDNARAAAPPLPTQRQDVITTQPNETTAETAPERPEAPSATPLADAINAIGAPPGGSLADVGKTMTLPISDAARIVGAPPGMSPGNVGKTTTLSLPTGPGQHP
jgi:hypothetical protein